MAFSYSDENFTVVGNLCFVHILLENKDARYDIPPAIADRMLIKKEFKVFYWSYEEGVDGSFGAATVDSSGIHFTSVYNCGYVSFHFPIDSNK